MRLCKNHNTKWIFLACEKRLVQLVETKINIYITLINNYWFDNNNNHYHHHNNNLCTPELNDPNISPSPIGWQQMMPRIQSKQIEKKRRKKTAHWNCRKYKENKIRQTHRRASVCCKKQNKDAWTRPSLVISPLLKPTLPLLILNLTRSLIIGT